MFRDGFHNRPLGRREAELILLLMAKDKASNQELAQIMNITQGTTKVYLNRIFNKLGVRTRGELIQWGVEHWDLLAMLAATRAPQLDRG
jgi:DNA-binding CsgD family transcriptional regulator